MTGAFVDVQGNVLLECGGSCMSFFLFVTSVLPGQHGVGSPPALDPYCIRACVRSLPDPDVYRFGSSRTSKIFSLTFRKCYCTLKNRGGLCT